MDRRQDATEDAAADAEIMAATENVGRCRGCSTGRWNLDWTLHTAEDDAKTLAATEHNGSYIGRWRTQRMLNAAEVAAEEAGRCRKCCIGPWTL